MEIYMSLVRLRFECWLWSMKFFGKIANACWYKHDKALRQMRIREFRK